MKENIYFNQALERIRKIKKSDNYDAYNLKGSHILLFLEHIIIIGKCAVKFNLLKGNLLDKDLCGELNEDWSYENSIDEDLQIEIRKLHRRGFHLIHYLNWELHRPELEVFGVEYAINPYEPIIKFIERYGTYGSEHGYLSLGFDYQVLLTTKHTGQPKKVSKMESYTNLDSESLNFADFEYLKDSKLFLENTLQKFCKDLKRL